LQWLPTSHRHQLAVNTEIPTRYRASKQFPESPRNTRRDINISALILPKLTINLILFDAAGV
jgi:hypothetical protein